MSVPVFLNVLHLFGMCESWTKAKVESHGDRINGDCNCPSDFWRMWAADKNVCSFCDEENAESLVDGVLHLGRNHPVCKKCAAIVPGPTTNEDATLKRNRIDDSLTLSEMIEKINSASIDSNKFLEVLLDFTPNILSWMMGDCDDQTDCCVFCNTKPKNKLHGCSLRCNSLYMSEKEKSVTACVCKPTTFACYGCLFGRIAYQVANANPDEFLEPEFMIENCYICRKPAYDLLDVQSRMFLQTLGRNYLEQIAKHGLVSGMHKEEMSYSLSANKPAPKGRGRTLKSYTIRVWPTVNRQTSPFNSISEIPKSIADFMQAGKKYSERAIEIERLIERYDQVARIHGPTFISHDVTTVQLLKLLKPPCLAYCVRYPHNLSVNREGFLKKQGIWCPILFSNLNPILSAGFLVNSFPFRSVYSAFLQSVKLGTFADFHDDDESDTEDVPDASPNWFCHKVDKRLFLAIVRAMVRKPAFVSIDGDEENSKSKRFRLPGETDMKQFENDNERKFLKASGRDLKSLATIHEQESHIALSCVEGCIRHKEQDGKDGFKWFCSRGQRLVPDASDDFEAQQEALNYIFMDDDSVDLPEQESEIESLRDFNEPTDHLLGDDDVTEVREDVCYENKYFSIFKDLKKASNDLPTALSQTIEVMRKDAPILKFGRLLTHMTEASQPVVLDIDEETVSNPSQNVCKLIQPLLYKFPFSLESLGRKKMAKEKAEEFNCLMNMITILKSVVPKIETVDDNDVPRKKRKTEQRDAGKQGNFGRQTNMIISDLESKAESFSMEQQRLDVEGGSQERFAILTMRRELIRLQLVWLRELIELQKVTD